jgi:hypothetical protein
MEQPTFSFHTFDDPADLITPTFNNLLGINNQGLIAGFYGSGAAGDPNQGFLLMPSSNTFTVTDFPPSAQNPAVHGLPLPQVSQTQVTGLNDNGIVVGYFYNTNMGVQFDNQFGFFEKNGVFTEVDNPNTPTTQPNPNPNNILIENQLIGVNNNDIAVGFYIDASGLSHGYTYDIKSGGFSANIDDPSAMSGGIVVGSTVTAAINNKGDIAGFYTNTGPTNTASVIHGFVDNHGVFTTVDAPGATTTELLGLNDQGIAVGFESFTNAAGITITHGIIYDTKTGTLTTLDAPNGTNSTTFNGINDKGEIVGFYTDATGTHGLLVDTVGITHMTMHV